MILTFRHRVKARSAERALNRWARAVNRVWNYCGETQGAARRHTRKWPSRFDLINLTHGCQAIAAAADHGGAGAPPLGNRTGAYQGRYSAATYQSTRGLHS